MTGKYDIINGLPFKKIDVKSSDDLKNIQGKFKRSYGIKPPLPPKPEHVAELQKKFEIKIKPPARPTIVVTKATKISNGNNIQCNGHATEVPVKINSKRILYNKLDDAFKALGIIVNDNLKDENSTSEEETSEAVDFEEQWLEPLEYVGNENELLYSSETSSSSEELPEKFSVGKTYSLCSVDDLQTSPSGQVTSESEVKTKSHGKVFNVAQEMLTSEQSYFENLQLFEKFKNYVIEKGGVIVGTVERKRDSNSPAIPETTLNHILFTLPNLQNLSENILSEFSERIKNWSEKPKIADVLINNSPYLKIYITYIKNLQKQANLLEKCAERHYLFGQCLKEFESLEDCKKIPVSKHMLVPLQRVVKYKELLKQYVKYLPENSEDHADAVKALGIVLDVAEHSNEAIKQLENTSKLLALQDRINGITLTEDQLSLPGTLSHVLVEPGRSLVKDGPLLKINRKTTKPVYLILLSDVLLYTSILQPNCNTSPLKLNEKLPLEGMRIEIPKADEFQNEFSVISTTRSFALQAKCTVERNDWIAALVDAIDANARRRSSLQLPKTAKYEISDAALGKQAPVWVPDNRVTMCQSCTAEFTIMFRRHHCRACGKVVCQICSCYRAPLQYMGYETARVCHTCFNLLQKELESIENEKDENKSEEFPHSVAKLRSRFKRGNREGSRAKIRPERLRQCASDIESQMSGYLNHFEGKAWNHNWWVLKDKVLYEYRAPNDVCALQSIPVLGYKVLNDFKDVDGCEGMDPEKGFLLFHCNQAPIVFHTESVELAFKWKKVMEEAVVL